MVVINLWRFWRGRHSTLKGLSHRRDCTLMRIIKRFIFRRFNIWKESSRRRSTSLAYSSPRAPMTGLRAIEQTIPSTLHTLLRPLRRTHFQEAIVRLCSKIYTKYDACTYSCRPRHGGIIRDDSKDPRHFAFLVFKAPLTAHALSGIYLENARHSRDYPATSISVVHFHADRMLRRVYKVKAR